VITFCKLLDAATGVVERKLDPAEISTHCHDASKVIWLDIQDPTEADLALLKEEFGFHPLALEDCAKAHSRPKLEKHPGYLFFVVYEVHPVPLTRVLQTVELNLFLGASYVVTVHRGNASVIAEVASRWEKFKGEAAHEGAGFLAYMLIDAAVDTYFPILDGLSDQLEVLEEGIFGTFQEGVVQEIFHLKKQTLLMRRLVSPLRDVFLILLRRDEALFGPRTYVYFQDVLDHLLRISDGIDNYRDLVGGAVDAYMTTLSNRTNETMKTLTVISTTLMLVTLVSGIYGMNFKVIPELSWQYGYFYALGLMLCLVATALSLFRWKKYI
jgi:magnesium transporter